MFKKILMFIMVLFTFSVVNVSAKEISVNKTSGLAGDDLIVTIDFDKSIEKVKIKYDRNIFDELDEDAFKQNNSDISYDSSDNTFSISNLDSSNKIKVVLHVKDDVKAGTTKISVDYSLEHDTLTSFEEINVNGIEDSKEEGFFANVKKNHPFVPYLLLAIMLILIVCAVYIYQKKKDKLKTNHIMVIIVSLLVAIILLILSIVIFSQHIDTLDDSKDMAEYVVKLNNQNVDENANEESDNNQTVSKEENEKPQEITYNASITSLSLNKKFALKDEELILTFTSDVRPYTDVKSVVINGKTYSVKKVGDEYQVIVKAAKVFDTQELTITKVILANGVNINTNAQTEVYVLKSAPKAENWNIDKTSEKPIITFDIVDLDNSFISGKVVITSTDSKVERKVVVGLNTIDDISFIENEDYKVEFYFTYDLDSQDTDENKAEDVLDYKSTFSFERDYAFELSEESLTNIVNDSNSLVLTFKNALYSYRDIEYVYIDGIRYVAEKKEDTYIVNDINKCSSKGHCQIEIEKVVLKDNAKTFEVNKSLSYLYLKNAPVMDSIVVNNVDSKVSGTFTFTDLDKTVTSATAILKDSEGRKIESVQAKLSDSLGTFENIHVTSAGKYYVEIELTYDLGNQEAKTISKVSDEFVEDIKANIKSITKENEFVERFSLTNLTYVIEANTESKLEYIWVNGIKYPTKKQEDGTYVVEMTINEKTYGEKTYETTKLVYENEQEAIIYGNTNVSLYVLKLEPSDIKVNAQIADSKISASFDYTDNEKSAIEAKAIILDEAGHEFKVIDNILSSKKFDDIIATKAGAYTVKIEITYDLGDGITKEISASKQVIEPIIANITKIENEQYIEKNGLLEVYYTIVSNTDDDLKQVEVDGEIYTVTKQDDRYKIVIDLSKKSFNPNFGSKELVTSKLIYDSTNVDASSNINFYILKDKPVVDYDYNVSEDKIILTITDLDNALKPDAYIVFKGSGEPIKYGITAGSNEIDIKDLTNDTYTITLEGKYDLDTTEGNPNEYALSDLFIEKVEKIITDYNPKITNLEAINFTSDSIMLKFNSTNEGGNDLSYVKIDGVYYPVSKQADNTYTVTLPSVEAKKEITITDVKLDNEKEATLKNQASILVYKDIPVVESFKGSVQNNKTVSATYKISDTDKTILSDNDGMEIYTYVMDSKEKIVTAKKRIDLSSSEVSFDEILKAGKYKIVIEVSYDRIDGNGKQTQLYKTDELEISIEATIVDSSVAKRYVAKGDSGGSPIEYTIQSNTDVNPKTITINDTKEDITYDVLGCELENNLENSQKGIYVSKCRIRYMAPRNYMEKFETDKNYGVVELTTKKMTYELEDRTMQDFTVSLDKKEKIEVLKASPYISLNNYTATGSYTNQTAKMTFTINDPDNAIMKDADGSFDITPVLANAKTSTQKVKTGEVVTVEFTQVPKNSTYLFYVNLKVDLNSEGLDKTYFSDYTVNINNSFSVGRIAFTLMESHDLNIHELSIIDDAQQSKTEITKNDKVKLRFKADSKKDPIEGDLFEDFHITSIVINNKTYAVDKVGDTYTTQEYLDIESLSYGSQFISIDKVTLNNHETLFVMGTKVSITVNED